MPFGKLRLTGKQSAERYRFQFKREKMTPIQYSNHLLKVNLFLSVLD